MPRRLEAFTDEQLLETVRTNGSKAGAARALDVAESTLKDELRSRGLAASPATSCGVSRSRRRRPAPRLTKESLTQAIQPPNNCKVRVFLDSLDDENRAVVEEALGYDKADMPAATLRTWLVDAGFHQDDVPGQDAINDHRAGRRPCRCHG